MVKRLELLATNNKWSILTTPWLENVRKRPKDMEKWFCYVQMYQLTR